MTGLGDLVGDLLRGIGEPLVRAWYEHASPRAAKRAFATFIVGSAAAALVVPLGTVAVCGGVLCGSTGLLWVVIRRRDRHERAEAERRRDRRNWPAVGVGRPRRG